MLPNGRVINLADYIEVKTTWPLLPPEQLRQVQAQAASPAKNCARPDETFLRKDRVLGQQTDVLTWKWQAGADREQVTEWRAPALGCQRLQSQTVALGVRGFAKLLGYTKAIALSLEEPDPKLLD